MKNEADKIKEFLCYHFNVWNDFAFLKDLTGFGCKTHEIVLILKLNSDDNLLMFVNDIDSRLICCVFQNMADEAIDILETKRYSKSLLENIGLLNKPFPLYWLVKCNEILLEDTNWVNDYYNNVVVPSLNNCRCLLKYFESNGLDFAGDVDYSLFPEERGHFVDCDMDEILDGDLDYLIKKGYDADECLLCHAVLTGNIEEIDRQIKKKTNPDVWISGDFMPEVANATDGSSYNAVVACNTFYCDCFDIYELRGYLEDGLNKKMRKINIEMLSELIEASFYRHVELQLLQINGTDSNGFHQSE